ncbi:PREDICTED: ubiA prenyltransferase domain-containing protein 1-like [Priapulus caudatus]|uniref:UbiA prenyltransferase domain-containing protein 1-like n=1 Tax=Priapulus caudatus TaxID=37621 RepID=A0ABM1F5U2_PRICU|nr:PREDICTED: ubiA prenyltransferase domain-containing protein 1-like [Priapulus caudatus]
MSGNNAKEQNGDVAPPGGVLQPAAVAITSSPLGLAVYNTLRVSHPRLAASWIALRPWTFSASLTPVAMGTALAYRATGACDAWLLVATLVTVLSVHGAGNLVNSYFDYQRGGDSGGDNGGDSALVYVVGCVGFGVVCWLSRARTGLLALLFFGGLSSSFLYTGGVGLKYVALGDVIAFVAFGPVCTLFVFAAQTAQASWLPLVYAIPLAPNTEAVVHASNARRAATDARVGIVTLAVLLGPVGSYALFVALLFAPYVAFAALGRAVAPAFYLPLLCLPTAFDVEREYRDGRLDTLPDKLARLNFLFGVLYTAACLLVSSQDMPLLAADACVKA